jgi:hypothetical protein
MISDEDIDDEAVRRTAFFLWEQDGRPMGQELYYWNKALEQHRRQLANDRQLAVDPPDRSDER